MGAIPSSGSAQHCQQRGRTMGFVVERALGIAEAVMKHRPISKLKLKVESQTHGGGRKETKRSKQ